MRIEVQYSLIELVLEEDLKIQLKHIMVLKVCFFKKKN